MKKFIIKVFYFLSSILILLISLFFYSFKKIKFCRADMSRLGGITFMDWYLSISKLKKKRSELIICFYDQTIDHINHQWFKIWKQKIFLIRNKTFFNILHFLILRLNLDKMFLINDKFLNQKKNYENLTFENIISLKEKYNLFIQDLEPNIKFPENDNLIGKQFLEKLGLNKQNYVCFHNRDESFLEKNSKLQDWSHHSFRNSNIENYIEAANYVTNQKLSSVRIGKLTDSKLNNKVIYDYANSDLQSDFGDICIIKNCSFFVCSDTGISNVAECFRKPVVYVNFAAFNDLFNVSTISKGLIIFKKIYDSNLKKYLNFDDLKKLNIRGSNILEILKKNNLILEENSSNEILDVTKEMYLRQIGKWQTNEIDDKKQRYFWNKYFPGFNNSLSLKIGKKYLEENTS
tara:strand:+ start:5458 stop:6669 length:1212 start_codon:yes stop_codon:yes gene_type:complete